MRDLLFYPLVCLFYTVLFYIFIRITFGDAMDTKLTIKLNKQVIERAKAYASSQQKSLSRLIESYLTSLVTHRIDTDNEKIQISPFVKSISSGKSLPTNLDYKKKYAAYVAKKYK